MAASVLTDGPIELDVAVYPEDCLHSAIEAYREFLLVRWLKNDSSVNVIELEIESRFAHRVEVRGEFLNYLLDLAAKRRLNNP